MSLLLKNIGNLQFLCMYSIKPWPKFVVGCLDNRIKGKGKDGGEGRSATSGVAGKRALNKESFNFRLSFAVGEVEGWGREMWLR